MADSVNSTSVPFPTPPFLAGAPTCTVIPTLGMTFAEAVAKVLALIDEQDATEGGDDLFFEWDPIREKVLAATPESIADAVAVLDLLLSRIGLPEEGIPDSELQAVTRLRGLLASIAGAQQSAGGAATDFAATVELFTTAGTATLAIPQTPNDVMVEAGATAAGITHDAFRRGYAAAIAAFQRDAA